MSWSRRPLEIIDEISNELGLGWDPDSVTALLENFIELHASEREFEEYVRAVGELELAEEPDESC